MALMLECPSAATRQAALLSCLAQVNMWNGFDAGVPFGGYKTSGIGREKGEAALSHYTQVSIMLLTEVTQLQNSYDNALHVQT